MDYTLTQQSKTGCFKPFIVLFILAAFLGCTTAKQHLNKAIAKDRVFVIDTLRKIAPCVTGEIKPGDSTAYNEYIRRIDSLINAYHPAEAIYDTVTSVDSANCEKWLLKLKVVQSKLEKANSQIKALNAAYKEPAPAIHDTIPVEDKAEVFVLQDSLVKARNENVKISTALSNMTERMKANRTWKWIGWVSWLFIAVVLYFVIRNRKLVNKLKGV